MLDILKIIFCIPFLIYSCYSDIKTRRVTNKLWLIMLTGAFFFIIYDVSKYSASYYLVRLFISVGFIYAFMYIIFRIGMFGGADAKLFIVLSVIFPIYPALNYFGYNFPLNKPLIDLFAYNIFDNTVILLVVSPIVLTAYNLIKNGLHANKSLFIFIGYRTKISELPGKHIKMIQNFEEVDGKVQFRFKWGGVEIDETIIRELKSLSEKGLIKDEVWVTPGIPSMVPITAGFFIAIFYGDLLFELIRYLILKN